MEASEITKIFFICLAVAVFFLAVALFVIFLVSITGKKQKTESQTEHLSQNAENQMMKTDAEQTSDPSVGTSITREIRTREENTLPADDCTDAPAVKADDGKTEESEAVTRRFGESDAAGLDRSASVPAAEDVTFEVVAKVILCDTQEVIE